MGCWSTQQQQLQRVLLLIFLLNAVTAHALRSKPPQKQMYLGVDQEAALQISKTDSATGTPLCLSLLQQRQAPSHFEVPFAGPDAVQTTDKKAMPSFLQHSGWVLPTESKQTRGMFNWYTNPYTYVIVGGMVGAFVGLGVWCIVASYTYKA